MAFSEKNQAGTIYSTEAGEQGKEGLLFLACSHKLSELDEALDRMCGNEAGQYGESLSLSVTAPLTAINVR